MKLRFALLASFVASAALPDPTKAQRTENNCHNIASDTERLACYDEQTGFVPSLGSEKAEVAEASGSQWQYEEEISSLDNRTDVWLSVPSKNDQPNQIGHPERARLWVRCMGNSTNAFITFNDFTSDNQNVRYKIGDGAIQKIWMVHMQGGDGIGIWSGRSAIPFIKSIFRADELVVAYKSYSNLNLEFTFDVSGLRTRIGPVAKNCNWKP